MKDPWIKPLTCILVGGLMGNFAQTGWWWLYLGLFVWLALGIYFFFPQRLGVEKRGTLLILCGTIIIGFIFGLAGREAIPQPLELKQTQIVGELQDWFLTDNGAVGELAILEPPRGGSFPQLSLGGSPEKSPEKNLEESLVGNKYRLRIYFDKEGNLPQGWDLIRPGDIIEFNGKIEHPKAPGTKGQFDYPRYYAVRGLSGTLTAQGEVKIIATGEPSITWQLRNQMREHLTGAPPELGGLLEGILFGDTGRVPQEELEPYRITGVYHIFSASGSNVAFMFALCWLVLGIFPPTLRVVVICGILILYAFLCGGNPPILRATIMGVFVLLGRLGKGRSPSLRGLLIAGVLLFLWQPLILGDVGFQLSFMATWGIIQLSTPLSKLSLLKNWPKVVRDALMMTLGAQLAILPLMIITFNRVSIIGLLANLLVLFMIGAIFELGILALFFLWLPIIALPLLEVSLRLLDYVSKGLFYLAQVPLADVWVVNPGVPFWLFWYGGIGVLLIGKEKVAFVCKVWLGHCQRKLVHLWEGPSMQRVKGFFKNILAKHFKAYRKNSQRNVLENLGRKFREICKYIFSKLLPSLNSFLKRFGIQGYRLLVLLLLLLLLWSPWHGTPVLEVTLIDVGQGDCILIETPGGMRLMVDTGPKTNSFDAGERIIVPYLLEQGINSLDALFLTHPHGDHVGGAGAILKTIPVGWIGIPDDGQDWLDGEGWTTTGDGWGIGGLEGELIVLLQKNGVERLKAGDRISLDSGIVIDVIGPTRVLTGTKSDENNNSLILLIKNKDGQRVLLTGDMEDEQMVELVRSGQDFDADLFKVPHHGSRFSMATEMLDQIHPKAVMIPVGKNTFGHPSSQVLSYWEERGVPIYRTDEDGTVIFRFDRGKMEVRTGRGDFASPSL
ncbi:MAG: ComEC/Rec2 family competence protein [Desulfitobacterium sp.]|nr:ComEC/Rec2 family competence protein [Desulfitobacterium sp.]